MEGLSPVSVTSVSPYNADQKSPSLPAVTRDLQVLGFMSNNSDSVLNTLSYNDPDILPEGSYEPSGTTFGSFENILHPNIPTGGNLSARLPNASSGFELLDENVRSENFIEPNDLRRFSVQQQETFCISKSLPKGNEVSEEGVGNKTSQFENPSNTISSSPEKQVNTKGTQGKPVTTSRTGNQQCQTCGKIFSNSSALTKHKLTHSDERKYVCPVCSKAFKRQDHLNGHMLTHRNKKPFECNVEGCGKSYCDARSLRRHKENHHSSLSSSSSKVIVTSSLGLGQLDSNSSIIPSTPFTAVTTQDNSPSKSNIIQYVQAPVTNVPAQSNVLNNNKTLNTLLEQQSSISHLRFLAFQQSQPSEVPSTTLPVDKNVLIPWKPKTVNANALLLSQSLLLDNPQIVSSQANAQFEDLSLGNVPQNIIEEQQKDAADMSYQIKICTPNIMNAEVSRDSIRNTLSPMTSTASDLKLPSINASTEVLPHNPPAASLSVNTHEDRHTPSNLTEHTTGASPLLQQLLTPSHQVDLLNLTPSSQVILSHSSVPLQQLSSSPDQQQQDLISQWVQATANDVKQQNWNRSVEPKQVECSLCQRKFKNVPALNGHMRLHGGYFKKENDPKKSEKLHDSKTKSLQTASINVRALIEEKIAFKKSQAADQQKPTPQVPDVEKPIPSMFRFNDEPFLNLKQEASENSPCYEMNQEEQNSYSMNEFSGNYANIPRMINTSEHQFLVPSTLPEKVRRHSDSDHFIPSKRICLPSLDIALSEPFAYKTVAKRTSRTGSDPGDIPGEMQTYFCKPHIHSLPATPTYPKGVEFFSTFPDTDNILQQAIQSQSLSAHFSQPSNERLDLHLLQSDKDNSIVPVSANSEYICSSLGSSENISNMVVNSFHGDTQGHFMYSTEALKEMSNSDMMAASQLPSEFDSYGAELPPDSHNSLMDMKEVEEEDDVFLSPPAVTTTVLKAKRKHKPEPLHIPPHVNHCGFGSRMRSPRLKDGVCEGKSASPPPYTPPPMLSPVRTGSGYFWHILSSAGTPRTPTPKSAPLTPSFMPFKRKSISEEPEIEEVGAAPVETDVLPHVNIGPQFQAKLPPFNANKHDAQFLEHKADKIWDPSILENIGEEELELYLQFSCCAAIPGGGRNKEYALHVLSLANGVLEDAIVHLMNPSPSLPVAHPLLSYSYLETDCWNTEEIELYHQALINRDKDFFTIANEVKTKSVKQCVQFYYLWKKVCPDEYKRLRIIRHRREQESIYFSNVQESEKVQTPTQEKSANDFSQIYENNNTEVKDQSEPSYNVQNPAFPRNTIDVKKDVIYFDSAVKTVPTEFPCKICGRVFGKIKSRSAHMKSHRPTDSDNKKNKIEY